MKRFVIIAAGAAAGALAASAGDFADIDTDANGTVSEAEFTAYKTAEGDTTEAEAAEKFAMIDADYDGEVTEAEMEEAKEEWEDKKSDRMSGDMSDTDTDTDY